MMSKLLEAIKHDVSFVKSHSLQPQWFKALKVFIILGFLAGYMHWFGARRTTVFFLVFLCLSLVVHLLYRTKTANWTRTWLDFVVVEEHGLATPKRIGRFYYAAIVLNTILSVVISQAS
jgi:cell division protein FtsW (lipid II flippase)